ncbi:MAG: tripartite tricarboxylate transporter substrate binding protein [Thermodesulfobacteriota bacterium]|nr:tripartite tricarboxylate transporter substrate binding protein [Thermodesulfobacteriota bacterium]
MKGRVIFSLVAVLILALGVSAYPQAYPTKPVMLMVAYPAGGSTDVGARIVASIAEKELGQPIVVLNKAGAGGQVGFTELAKQKPDGSYIGLINLPALNTIILDPDRKATFDIDTFTPIINQVLDPGVIYVKPDSHYKNLKDLVVEAKKRPGEIKVGTTGILGDDHLAILMLEEAAGVKLRIVHFEGDTPQVTALLGGQIDVSFLNVGGLTPRVKAGQLRVLAVMDKERSKFYPDVPTSVEQGYPAVISSSTRGIAGPKGLPEPIVKKLQAVFKKAIENPEHMEKMDNAGLAIKMMMGDEYGKYFRELHDRTKPLVDAARKAR